MTEPTLNFAIGCAPSSSSPSWRRAFVQDCVACHGADGLGTGPLAAGLDLQPADLRRIGAPHGGTVPRDAVMSAINGDASDPHRPMPHFHVEPLGDLGLVENANGTTTPTPERLLALANFLESIQQ